MDFNDVIRELFDSHITDHMYTELDSFMEDFTTKLSKAVSKVYKEEQEKEERDRERRRKEEEEEKEKERVKNALIDILNASIDTNSFNYKTAAAVCTLAYMDRHNESLKQNESDKVFRTFMESLPGDDFLASKNLEGLREGAKKSVECGARAVVDRNKKAEAPIGSSGKSFSRDKSVTFSADTDRVQVERFLKKILEE